MKLDYTLRYKPNRPYGNFNYCPTLTIPKETAKPWVMAVSLEQYYGSKNLAQKVITYLSEHGLHHHAYCVYGVEVDNEYYVLGTLEKVAQVRLIEQIILGQGITEPYYDYFQDSDYVRFHHRNHRSGAAAYLGSTISAYLTIEKLDADSSRPVRYKAYHISWNQLDALLQKQHDLQAFYREQDPNLVLANYAASYELVKENDKTRTYAFQSNTLLFAYHLSKLESQRDRYRQAFHNKLGLFNEDFSRYADDDPIPLNPSSIDYIYDILVEAYSVEKNKDIQLTKADISAAFHTLMIQAFFDENERVSMGDALLACYYARLNWLKFQRYNTNVLENPLMSIPTEDEQKAIIAEYIESLYTILEPGLQDDDKRLFQDKFAEFNNILFANDLDQYIVFSEFAYFIACNLDPLVLDQSLASKSVLSGYKAAAKASLTHKTIQSDSTFEDLLNVFLNHSSIKNNLTDAQVEELNNVAVELEENCNQADSPLNFVHQAFLDLILARFNQLNPTLAKSQDALKAIIAKSEHLKLTGKVMYLKELQAFIKKIAKSTKSHGVSQDEIDACFDDYITLQQASKDLKHFIMVLKFQEKIQTFQVSLEKRVDYMDDLITALHNTPAYLEDQEDGDGFNLNLFIQRACLSLKPKLTPNEYSQLEAFATQLADNIQHGKFNIRFNSDSLFPQARNAFGYLHPNLESADCFKELKACLTEKYSQSIDHSSLDYAATDSQRKELEIAKSPRPDDFHQQFGNDCSTMVYKLLEETIHLQDVDLPKNSSGRLPRTMLFQGRRFSPQVDLFPVHAADGLTTFQAQFQYSILEYLYSVYRKQPAEVSDVYHAIFMNIADHQGDSFRKVADLIPEDFVKKHQKIEKWMDADSALQDYITLAASFKSDAKNKPWETWANDLVQSIDALLASHPDNIVECHAILVEADQMVKEPSEENKGKCLDCAKKLSSSYSSPAWHQVAMSLTFLTAIVSFSAMAAGTALALVTLPVAVGCAVAGVACTLFAVKEACKADTARLDRAKVDPIMSSLNTVNVG